MLDQEFAFLTELERYDEFLRLYRSLEGRDADQLERLYRSADPLIPLILLQYLEDLPERQAIGAIIRLIEHGSDVVAKAACAAYQLNHFPGKARLLKQLVLSKNVRACRFAVRTLSRAGFMEILPLVLRELPDREGPERLEMIEALRYLPDGRSISVLLPLASSKDDNTRHRALQVLADLQPRLKALPVRFFLNLIQDPSERARRIALEALQRYPTRKVTSLILDSALDAGQPEEQRTRSIRALASFPSWRWVRPLTEVAVREESAALRLAVEATMRHTPAPALKQGLLPLLREENVAMRRRASVFAADLLGKDPEVREALYDVWRSSDEASALELIEALGMLGGDESAALLRDAVGRSPVLAYASAAALARMRGTTDSAVFVDLLKDPKVQGPARQALLDRLVKRGPEESVKAGLLPLLVAGLEDAAMNIRYLSLQALAWYPPPDTLVPILGLLSRESSTDVVRTASRILAKGLGRDPRPLVTAVREHPARPSLVGHMVRIMTSQNWSGALILETLESLKAPPLSLLEDTPETFFTVCAHLMGYGALSLAELWPALEEREGRMGLCFEVLASAILKSNRRFGPLPVDFLGERCEGMGAATRGALYELLAADGSPGAVELLTARVLDEADPAATARGGAALRRHLLERPE